jgi:hypothetical protein
MVVVITVLILFAGAYFMKKEPPADGKDDPRARESQVLKLAKNIVMYEKRFDTDKTFVIRARTVTQQTQSIFFMDNFRMDRSDGMKVEGGHARYDMEGNRLAVVGPMTVSTPDGWRADLSDVDWDRKDRHAKTDKPVKVTGAKGTLRGDRAEFFNDFSRMELSGNVHAQVNQKLLAD